MKNNNLITALTLKDNKLSIKTRGKILAVRLEDQVKIFIFGETSSPPLPSILGTEGEYIGEYIECEGIDGW